MQLMPEARIANECLLSVFRTLKYTEFPPDTQKIIMECVGRCLIYNSTLDRSIDDAIADVEKTLYGDISEMYKWVLGQNDIGD